MGFGCQKVIRARTLGTLPITLGITLTACMQPYSAAFKSVQELSPLESEGMMQLYESLYTLPDRQIFRTDLAAKDEVLLLRSGDDLVGFTTLQIYDFPFQGLQRRIVFSGDTVVHREHWGQQALASAWIRHVGKLHQQNPDLHLYWFLVVKGHRTYRFLPTFCRRFHPHWAMPTPDLKDLADALALNHFGCDYDPGSGVVRYQTSRGHLSPDIAHPTDSERQLPAVQFFLERNPGYLHGHELVCLFEFTECAMRPLTRRLFLGRA